MATGNIQTTKLSQHFIFGHRFGFPGGVSWSILVARECKGNPLASPSTLVKQALTTLVQWPWSNQELQLSLDSLTPPPGLHEEEHPPRFIMSILTPSKPPTNTTHTMSSSSLAVLQQEASRALALIEVGRWEEALPQMSQLTSMFSIEALIEVGRWEEAFQAASLPQMPHFLVVEAKSTAAEEQVE